MSEDKRQYGINQQIYARDKILNISSASIYDVDNNPTGRLSAQDGNIVLRAYERTIRLTTSTASGDITVYLPDEAECVGEIITINVTIADAEYVTIKNFAGASLFVSISVDDTICLLSTGYSWVVVTVTTV